MGYYEDWIADDEDLHPTLEEAQEAQEQAKKLAALEDVAKAKVVAEIGQERADRHEEAGEWVVKTYLLGANPRIR
jgi:hypothetical protein